MELSQLKQYASLIARKGVNVQKGQEVHIQTGLDQPQFVTLLVQACYEAGAKKVVVDWTLQAITKEHVQHQSTQTLCDVTQWELAKM